MPEPEVSVNPAPTKTPRLNRRQFLKTAVLTVPYVLAADAALVEPTAVEVRRVRIGSGPAIHRLVHFSDVHHKGDVPYLKSVVATINSLKPDFACFTGDIVEHKQHLPEALEIFSAIKSPLFGVPGNHDFASGMSFKPVRDCFAATGGAWLMSTSHEIPGQNLNVIGSVCRMPFLAPPPRPQCKNIFLTHFPADVNELKDRNFDLLLAGHSHGGQVRLPLIGSVIVPRHVGTYDMGLYQTASGPLYVNPGIGYLGPISIRFNCRPEITVIEI